MQLRETFPFDVKNVIAALPPNGVARHAVRSFTLAPRADGRARSVKALAQKLGFDVREVQLRRGENGRLVTDPFTDSGYRIEVNQGISVRAKRFAVLHELGHFYRHVDKDDPLADDFNFSLGDAAFYVDPVKEREANEFAEAILFGNGQLAAASTLMNFDIQKIADFFGVSTNVVEVALRKLRRF